MPEAAFRGIEPMDHEEDWRNGACHCGAVRFRVRLAGGLETARRCDCSYCRMRGAVVLTARKGDIEILEGADTLTLYRFNTGVAKHWFCSRCGIYTHHGRRSNPDEFGINAACLEGVSPFDFTAIPVNNGRSHPSDGGPGPDVIGTLRFVPAEDG